MLVDSQRALEPQAQEFVSVASDLVCEMVEAVNLHNALSSF